MKLIVSNHKMNLTLEEVKKYSQEMNKVKSKNKIIICPSYPYLSYFLSDAYFLGAQNVSNWQDGSYTGEVSAHQLKSLGVSYCLVGHSERRKQFGETTSDLIQKIKNLTDHRIIPILCLGEKNRFEANKVDQLKEEIDIIFKEIDYRSLVIAYEPIWAIGTGEIPTSKEITDMISELKIKIKNSYHLDIKVLYGGSVNPENIKQLKQISEIDGYLIGGTSLDINKWKQIIEEMEEE